MVRSITVYVAALALTVASLVLANARGASHDMGTDIVICSGIGMTTITIGPDGVPVKTTEPCPDGTSVFAACFSLPVVADPVARLLAHLAPVARPAPTTPEELTPSARGPPTLA